MFLNHCAICRHRDDRRQVQPGGVPNNRRMFEKRLPRRRGTGCLVVALNAEPNRNDGRTAVPLLLAVRLDGGERRVDDACYVDQYQDGLPASHAPFGMVPQVPLHRLRTCARKTRHWSAGQSLTPALQDLHPPARTRVRMRKPLMRQRAELGFRELHLDHRQLRGSTQQPRLYCTLSQKNSGQLSRR